MPFNSGANKLKSGCRAASRKRILRPRGRSDKTTGRGRGNGTIAGLDTAAIASFLAASGRLSDIKYIPLTDPVLVTPLNQIEMDVTIMIGIGAVTEYGRETSFDQTAFVE